MRLDTPVRFIKGVGPERAKIFAKLGVYTVMDLLEYYPRDWDFMQEPAKIDQLQPGQKVTIIGTVKSTHYRR